MGGVWVAIALCCVGATGQAPARNTPGLGTELAPELGTKLAPELGTKLAFELGPELGPELVLEPGQERAAARVVGSPGVALAPGWSLRAALPTADRIRVVLDGPAGPVEVAVLAPDAEGPGLVRARRGAFVAPPTLPEAVSAALRGALDAPGPAPRWRRLVAATDPARAAREGAALATRWSDRVGAAGHDSAPVVGGPSATGTDAEIAALLAASALPPPGTLSRWLASTTPNDAPPCPPQGGCPAAEIVRDLAAGRLDPSRLALWSDEPGVLARAASLAAETGQPELATALLAQALMANADDAEAHAVAGRFGWGVAVANSQEIAGDLTRSAAPPPVLVWLALAGLFCSLALALAWRSGAQLERVAFTLGLLAALAVAAWLRGLTPPQPSPPRLETAWLELGRGTDGCRPSPPAVTASAWHALVRCPDGAATVRLSAAPTGGLAASVASLSGSPEPSPELSQWVARALRDAHASGLHLAPSAAPATAKSPAFSSRIAARRPLERAALLLAGPTVALALAAAIALLVQALCALGQHARAYPRWGWGLAAAAAIALLTHALAPSRLVMVYDGYAQTQALIAMEPLRYGAGANWLYGPILAWWPDHAAVQLANRVYGLAALVALWALAARLWPTRPALPTLLAFLTASAPLLWRDHASESILVAPTALLLLGAFAIANARDRAFPLLLAAPCLAAASLSRPELGPAALALAALVLLRQRPRWPTRGWLAAALVTAAALCLAPPHIALIRHMVAWLVATGALPGLDGLWPRASRDFLTLGGLRVVLTGGPALLVAFLAASLFARRDRWLAAGLIALALAWAALTRVDLPDVSIPRVHAPPWMLFALAGALGADLLWTASARLNNRRAVVALRALVVTAWLASAGLTLGPLYAPTNADTEEALLREAAARLPPGHVCLATLDETDPPLAGKTPRFFPFYLFADRQPAPTLSSLAALDPSASTCSDGAYALLGLRCYMALREDATAGPPPPGSPMVSGCQTFVDRHRLEPLTTYDAPNYGDRGFDLYPAGATLPVGLYRVR